MEDGLKEALQFAADQNARALLPQEHPRGGKFVVVGEGQSVAVLEPLVPILHHVKQRVALTDAASFAAYLNTFKSAHTRIFADVRKPLILGVIDYHQPAPGGKDVTNKPDYCEHAAAFEPRWSEQWARWRKIDGQAMSQATFAEFLEENYMDVMEPAPADMLDVVTTLEAKKNVSFVSGIRLQTGANQLTYSEEIETKGKGTLSIPPEFKIGLPVFYNGTVYQVRVLLRYRITEGKLTFTAKLNRRDFVEQTAFNEVVKEIGSKTGIEPFMGASA